MENSNAQKSNSNPYKDNSKRTRNLIYVFWALTAVSLLAVISGYLQIELLKDIQEGIPIDEQKANVNDIRQSIIGLLQLGLYIASIVVFLLWFRRAYANLERMGVKIQFSESMALWAWFIPIIFLFRPYQIMNEIWSKTQTQINTYDPSYPFKKGEIIIGFWWALFVISNFFGRYLLSTIFKNDSVDQIIESSQATLISDAMQIPEGLLVILIVTMVSKMEKKLSSFMPNTEGDVIMSQLIE